MALQDQVLPVPFTQGVDNKIDAKALPAGKLISLVNGTFPQYNQITKRNGYSNIQSFQSLLTRSFNNQLLLGDGASLYAYSADSQTKQNVGNYTGVSVIPTNIPISRAGARNVRTASYTSATGNYACTCYVVTPPGSGAEFMYITVVDTTTGVVILSDIDSTAAIPINSGIGNAFSQVFVINSSGTPSFGILYPGSTSELTFASVTVSAGVATVSPNHTLDGGGTVTSFNAINSGGTGTYVSYTLAGITPKVGLLVGNSFSTIVTANTMTNGSIFVQTASCFDTSGNIWTMVGYENTGGTTATLQYFIYPPSLSSPILNSTLITTYVSVDVFDPSAIALSPQSNGSVRGYYSRKTLIGSEGSPTGAFFLTTSYYTLAIGGSSVGPVLFAQNAELSSNFVTYSGKNYVVLGNVLPSIAAVFGGGSYTSSTVISDENAYFLVEEVTGSVVGKCLAGTAIPLSLDQYFTYSGSSLARPNVNTLRVIGNSLYFGCSTILQNSNEADAVGTALAPLIQVGAKLEQFNFADAQAYQSTIFQNTAVFNGAAVKGYDGESLTELGFFTYPDYLGLTAGGGGAISAGTYGYGVTYSWVDSNNQQYESFPLQKSVAVGASGSVTLVIQTLGLTEKGRLAGQAPYINIYRTDATGQIYYFLERILNPYSASAVPYYTATVPYITYTDKYGASLAGQPELYNTGGVLENDPPPPSMILTVRENRLYAVDSENPNTDYWFTKTPNKGFGISFSAFLVESIDSVGGAITSQAQMDEKLVTFKNTSLGYQVGDGPNDTGANSSLSNFQFIPADTGSNNNRATIVIPGGCMFQSNKGIYLLDRGLQVTYKGSPVQSFNNQFITQATMMQSVNSVRFLVSSGSALVYNYFFDQWATFSNHAGTSADVFQGKYTYSRFDTKVFQENFTSFLDDTTAYSLNLQIAWLKFATIQGFQRIKQMLVLGDHKSPVAGHGLSIAAAYNYDQSGFGTPVTFTFSANTSTSNFQFRDFFAQQKCNSLALQLNEVTTSASGEYIDLTDLTFLAGIKKGLNKLSAADSVG